MIELLLIAGLSLSVTGEATAANRSTPIANADLAAYAAQRDLEFDGRRWSRFGEAVRIPAELLTTIGEVDGEPVFAEASRVRGGEGIRVIYLAADDEGRFQPYRDPNFPLRVH